jgi:hypothetical protein
LLATVPLALVLVPVTVGKLTNTPVGMLDGPTKDELETVDLLDLLDLLPVLPVDEAFDDDEVVETDVSRWSGKESVIVTFRYP